MGTHAVIRGATTTGFSGAEAIAPRIKRAITVMRDCNGFSLLDFLHNFVNSFFVSCFHMIVSHVHLRNLAVISTLHNESERFSEGFS